MADTKVTEVVEKPSVINASQSSEDVNTTSKSKDAFDVLMKSRSKVIGSNSPGKELQASPNDTNDGSRERKVKRKLILEEWAMAKGGNLNKQKETLREEMIKKTLKRRKTKFTNMLVKSTDEINQEKQDKHTPNSSPNVSKTHKIITPRSVKKKVETNKRIIVSDDEEFLEKLSPSLKKKENLLCYLKKENRESNFDQKNDSSNSSDSNKALNQIKVKIISKRMTNSVDKKRKVHSPCISNKSSSNSSKNLNDECLDKNNSYKSDVSECMDIVDRENHEKSNDFSENGSNRLRRSQRINTKRSIIVKNRDFVFPDSGSSDVSEDDCVVLKNNSSLKHNGKENIILLSDSPPSNLKSNSSKASKKSKTDPPSKKIKLAPLFTKGTVKPFIDHEVLKARQNFLYSSLEPSSKAPQLEPVLESNTFHIVTHIKQIPDLNSPEFYIWNLPSLVNGLFYDEECVLEKVLESNNLISLKVNENKPVSDVFNKIQTYNMKDGLLKLKTIHPKYPIIKFFKQMRQKNINLKNNGFDNNVNEECFIIGTSNNVNENTCIIEKNDYDIVLWTEKYKPLSSNESIGNFKSIELLKKWLMSWKDYGQELSSAHAMKRKVDSDSSSEFWSSDSNSRQSSGFIDNTYVLTGPVGSGKTSSVYAIANELNINVIEVNASSKRTGKKILMKLQEATQSHKVKIGNKSDKIDDNKPNIFSNKKNNSTEKKKKKERLLKSKSKPLNKNSSSPTKDKMSLILIEDADIVFDEDDGFVNALSQIVRFSKRPVIIVATEINCSHLKKFVSEHNIIKFHSLSGHIVSPWFNLLMLMESNKIYPMLCQLLVHFYKGDIRKTIMHLQCWILGNRKNDSTINKCVENDSICEDITLISHCSDNEDSSSRDINIKEDDICDSKLDMVIAENSSVDILNDIIYLSPKQEISWNISKFHFNISNNSKSKNRDIDFDSLCQTLEVISSIDHLQSYKKNISESGVYIPRWCYTGDNLLELERQDEYYDDFTSNYCSEMIACNEHLQNSSSSVSLHEAFSADFEKER